MQADALISRQGRGLIRHPPDQVHPRKHEVNLKRLCLGNMT